MRSPTTILVATDFGEPAEHALEYALLLAANLDAGVTVMHAYDFPVVGIPDASLVANAAVERRIVSNAQTALDETIARTKSAPVDLTSMLEASDPRSAILSAAERAHADLIVIGTHGRRGFSRALLGSVAEHVVRNSERPVLTVH